MPAHRRRSCRLLRSGARSAHADARSRSRTPPSPKAQHRTRRQPRPRAPPATRRAAGGEEARTPAGPVTEHETAEPQASSVELPRVLLPRSPPGGLTEKEERASSRTSGIWAVRATPSMHPFATRALDTAYANYGRGPFCSATATVGDERIAQKPCVPLQRRPLNSVGSAPAYRRTSSNTSSSVRLRPARGELGLPLCFRTSLPFRFASQRPRASVAGLVRLAFRRLIAVSLPSNAELRLDY